MTWRRWFLLMLLSTALFLAWGYRHDLWEWWHFTIHQPITQTQYRSL